VALIRALEANPAYGPALINLAVDSIANGSIAGCERLVRRALEVDPEDAFATIWMTFLCILTNRDSEVVPLCLRLRKLSTTAFYISASYALRAWSEYERGDLGAAEDTRRAGLADGAMPENMRTVEAAIAVRAGRAEVARRILHELDRGSALATGSLVVAAGTAVRLGEIELAVRFMSKPIVTPLAPILSRLVPELHPMLDHPPFSPRRLESALVWPLESPMIDPVRHGLFKEVRIESGRPRGSDVLSNL
jgi:hypothetical protein